MEGTDSLRELAPRWSLAGDNELLNLLQGTHQRIVSKCREVNTKLDEMASALDSASINLQNVNNRFMALSNSKFIESRVYDDDDDADVTTETKPLEEPQKLEATDEITLLKRSLAILDDAHEMTEILDDSDTDDSDFEISVVLKPRDAYAHRPLPYIIGSQAWKNKWHAGLILEDSDSDSVTSKQEREMEEYSESEDDILQTQNDKLAPDTTISESSSSFHSERDKDLGVAEKRQTPAEVAAGLAARLGIPPPRMVEDPEDLPQSIPKTVYRPQKPLSSTIFPEEPPPLDHDSDTQEDDIFAEINKQQPYNNKNRAHNVTDDLFGRTVDDYDYKTEPRSAKQQPTLFDDDSEPELFVEKPRATEESAQNRNYAAGITKKPIGGISLFGSNKGTESIGAAILKRNEQKSFSDNESDTETENSKNDTDDKEIHNANYIFDNLFAKAKQAEEKMAKQITDNAKTNTTAKVNAPVKEKPKPAVKDLFSDNIFDDIDDIFTSNIKIPTKEANKNAKSIFDDDGDLFSDIAKTKEASKPKVVKATSKKSIFDSDDDLFSDVKTKVIKNDNENKSSANIESKVNKPIKETNNNTTKPEEPKKSLFDDSSEHIESNTSKVKSKAKSKSIFDSDSDDDLFSDVKIKTKVEKAQEPTKSKPNETESELFEKKQTEIPLEKDLFKKKETSTVKDVLKTENVKVFQSPSLFEEDEIDDLFINANKAKIANLASENTIPEHKLPENISEYVNKDINDKEYAEEYQDFDDDHVKVDKKSNMNEDISPKQIENIKPFIVDTTPYIFPQVDEQSSKLQDEKETINTKVTSKDIKEISPTKVQNDSIDEVIESTLPQPSKIIDFDAKNDENEIVIPKTQELFSETIKETPESKVNKDKMDNLFETVKEKEVVPEKKSLVAIATFDDIFSEPPAFETKEVKKTTNVNALFDDDSDDEALFFKKNDVVSDEKPDIFTPSANFGIFNDEPPAFLDFTPKTANIDDDLFSSIPKNNTNTKHQPDDEWIDDPRDDVPKPTQKLYQDDDLCSSPVMSNTDTNSVKPSVKVLGKEVPDSDDELFRNVTTNEPNTTKESLDQLDDAKRDKKIGKLNTKNFNINVQALVPGASPKKIPKENVDTKITNIDDTNKTETKTTKENKEGNIITKEKETKITKEINASPENEPKIVKSISFENKPDSGVLDNNLSKQRPRIQVKRRPSSRKARHEAVRKSVIDLDDDTDNSSSFDEPLPKVNQNESKESNKQIPKTIDKFADNFSDLDEPLPKLNHNKIEKSNEQDQIPKSKEIIPDNSSDFDEPMPKLDQVPKESNIQKNQAKTSTIDTLQDESSHNDQNTLIFDDFMPDKESSTHKKNISKEESDKKVSKMPKVDINSLLNSDISGTFNIHNEITKSFDEVDANVKINETKSNIFEDQNEEAQSTTKVKYILNDEDIFSDKKEKARDDNKIVETRGTDDGLFQLTKDGDDDDDDLFKTKGIKTIGNTYKDTKIASTSTDLKPQSKTIKTDEPSKTVQPKKETKSLFDLSDDEDDLFGKGAKMTKKDVKSKLFESDSEDDLFSGKKKVKEDNKKVKEDVKKVKEVPKVGGSLFGDDDDDLFGVKTNKNATEPTKRSASSSRSVSKDTKVTEVVFDDPLSMLDDD